MKFVLATTNLHKILELRAMLKPLLPAIDILSLRDFPTYVQPEEDGDTFLDNAKKKASHAASSLGVMALADDSGLVIPALNGEPGVRSARYAGNEATDKDNRKKLIENLKKVPEEERMGYFECALVLATPEKVLKTATGYCEGRLILDERGSHGFGYDFLFIKHDYSKTLAELDEDTKNRVSHRRKALDKLSIALESLVNQSCTTI